MGFGAAVNIAENRCVALEALSSLVLQSELITILGVDISKFHMTISYFNFVVRIAFDITRVLEK